jgi:uncharacterized protein YqgV (UPF0045/DUF77 family)
VPDTEVTISAEFLVEPFEEGNPGPHVIAAIDRVTAADLPVERGPFGNTTHGSASTVLPAVAEALQAAMAAGATRVTVNVTTD